MPSQLDPKWLWIVALAALLGAASCRAAQPSTEARVSLHYILYCQRDLLSEARQALMESSEVASGALLVAGESGHAPVGRWVRIESIPDVAANAPPPDLDALKHFGVGLSAQQGTELQTSDHAIGLVFAHPRRESSIALFSADTIVHELARETQCLIWDDEIRLVYAPESFESERLKNAVPSIASAMNQTTIHSYKDGDFVRSVSLGMSKFGAPDLVIESMSWATSQPLGWIMIGLQQTILEGGRPDGDGALELNVRELRHPAVRAAIETGVRANGTLAGRFRLIPVAPQEGDADNALMAIRFDGFDGPDEFARQDQAASSIFGWSDEVKHVDHDAELLAASEKARLELPRLRLKFAAGLAPGEFLQVKAPFETDSGNREWMWVEITVWNDERMAGLLSNEPFDVSGLHAGQVVEVREDEVFDYLHTFPDGHIEGNQTSAIIERMHGRSESAGAPE